MVTQGPTGESACGRASACTACTLHKGVASPGAGVWVVVAAVIGTLAYTELLKSLGSALPALDGATVVVSIVAQVLMVLRYREQWVLWIVVNILTISLWAAMWLHHGETSLPLLVMYGMYLCNSLYGYYNWTQLLRRHRTGHAF